VVIDEVNIGKLVINDKERVSILRWWYGAVGRTMHWAGSMPKARWAFVVEAENSKAMVALGGV